MSSVQLCRLAIRSSILVYSSVTLRYPDLFNCTHMLRSFVQLLLILFCLADAGIVRLELCGSVEGRAAVDTGERGATFAIMLLELRLLYSIAARLLEVIRRGKCGGEEDIHHRN
jgi:hypothetical protein